MISHKLPAMRARFCSQAFLNALGVVEKGHSVGKIVLTA